jgi:hypothetical protein
MRYLHQFKIDLTHLAYRSDDQQKGEIEYLKKRGAQDLGLELLKDNDYKLDNEASYSRKKHGPIDIANVMNVNHSYYDQYRLDLVVFSFEEWQRFKTMISRTLSLDNRTVYDYINMLENGAFKMEGK